MKVIIFFGALFIGVVICGIIDKASERRAMREAAWEVISKRKR